MRIKTNFLPEKRYAFINLPTPLFFFQLHTIVTDDSCNQVTELYQQEQGNLATGGSSATQHTRAVSEAAYQKRSESLLSDENCYKVVIVSVTLLFFRIGLLFMVVLLLDGCTFCVIIIFLF